MDITTTTYSIIGFTFTEHQIGDIVSAELLDKIAVCVHLIPSGQPFDDCYAMLTDEHSIKKLRQDETEIYVFIETVIAVVPTIVEDQHHSFSMSIEIEGYNDGLEYWRDHRYLKQAWELAKQSKPGDITDKRIMYELATLWRCDEIIDSDDDGVWDANVEMIGALDFQQLALNPAGIVKLIDPTPEA